jgi:hypothetical protein
MMATLDAALCPPPPVCVGELGAKPRPIRKDVTLSKRDTLLRVVDGGEHCVEERTRPG